MRLGILLRRQNHVPHVEGIIRAAAASGHHVILIADEATPDAKRTAEIQVPARLRPMVRWLVVGDWSRFKADWLDAIVVPAALRVPMPILQSGVPCVAVQTTWSDLMDLDATPYRAVYGWGHVWYRWWCAMNVERRTPSQLRAMHDRFVPVGLPIADHLNWMDPEVIRARLGVRQERLVVYLPFPFGSVPRHPWSHGVYGLPWPLGLAAVPFVQGRRAAFRQAWYGQNDRAVVEAVKGYAVKHGARLIVGARPKTRLPGYLRRAADGWVPNDATEPDLLHVLSVADHLVHFYSTGSIEASVIGLPSTCIAPTAEQWPSYAGRTMLDAWGVEQPWMRLYGYGGLSEFMRPEHVPILLPMRGMVSAAMVSDTTQRYVGDFFDGHIGVAGKRVVSDLTERILGREEARAA